MLAECEKKYLYLANELSSLKCDISCTILLKQSSVWRTEQICCITQSLNTKNVHNFFHNVVDVVIRDNLHSLSNEMKIS